MINQPPYPTQYFPSIVIPASIKFHSGRLFEMDTILSPFLNPSS